MLPNHEKKKRLLCESMFVATDKQTLIQKNGRKRSFSYETKALLGTMNSFWSLGLMTLMLWFHNKIISFHYFLELKFISQLGQTRFT